jgi:hypothetical protein
MEENLTIEQKANTLIGCANVGGCKSQFVNYCQRSYKDGFMCTQKKMLLLMADFVIDKAVAWLRENCTDWFDKIEDCAGGNEWETQAYSFPNEFLTKFRNEIKNE